MAPSVFYTRKLPHWQPSEETFFITYRLFGSLPISIIEALKEFYFKEKQHPDNQNPERKQLLRQEYFIAFENELDKNLNEPYWLKNDVVADTVLKSLFFRNNTHYTLFAACIMSNHVHILIRLLPYAPPLNVILQNHKRFTAVQSNKLLRRSGAFWAEESYDTIIRDNKHFYNTVYYIIQNPVKSGLVKNWCDWKWTYLHPDLEKEYRLPG
jgi:REP element-mobilizing transposase RayT